MSFFYSLLKPLLFKLNPETAHNLAHCILRSGLYPRCFPHDYPALHTSLFGLNFPNPIGLAAGFDKNAELIPYMLGQGFGFVEVGTVTPKPQKGNPKPRLFRLEEDNAIINRMGFNNKGMEVFVWNLEHRQGIVGANIGKNKDSSDAVSDYLTLLEAVYGLSEYITINISSPNTPGLRALQSESYLHDFLSAIQQKCEKLTAHYSKKIPILLKIAPDLNQAECEVIASTAMANGIDGLIISNTTIERKTLQSQFANEAGGLSGKPLFTPSTAMLKTFYQLTNGKLPLIGVGGISSGEDAYAKIKAGASLVQLYSALIYEGFGLVNSITKELNTYLTRDGFTSVSEAVGVEVS